jgi:hypothetical protein
MTPTCHPDRKVYALELCNPCYQRERYAKDADVRKRTIARASARQKAKVERKHEQRESAEYEKWAAPRRRDYAPTVCECELCRK